MGTQTTNQGFNKPQVGGDTDNWGALLNANADALDAILDPDGNGTPVGLRIGDGNTLKVEGDVSLDITGTISATAGEVDVKTQGSAADNTTKAANTAWVNNHINDRKTDALNVTDDTKLASARAAKSLNDAKANRASPTTTGTLTHTGDVEVHKDSSGTKGNITAEGGIAASDVSVTGTVTGSTYVGLPTSSETVAGIVEKATDAEVDGRTDNSRWFSVKQLLRIVASTTAAGLARFATNDETSTGTSSALAVTPAGLASMRASDNDASAGTNTSKFVTPKQLADYVEDNAGGGMEFLGAFTSSGTLSVPSGAKVLRVYIAAGAGGGGGGGASGSSSWQGAGSDGSAGEASSFGDFITILGGAGGTGGVSGTSNSAGGIGKNGGSYSGFSFNQLQCCREANDFGQDADFGQGGAGGSATSTANGENGGSGGAITIFRYLVNVTGITSVSITIGNGGSGGKGGGNQSTNGGNGGSGGNNGSNGITSTNYGGAGGGGGAGGFVQVWRMS